MLAYTAPSGVFVCGGMTPSYQQAVCTDPAWLRYLHEANMPYGGTSAGAAIAAQNAIVGGWQTTRQGQQREILFVGASEGIDPLTVKQGLGLVPFAVDVHASQMGTLTRLIHAVELGLVDEGWAIDENTLLAVDTEQMQVYGQGHCYHVWKQSGNAVQLSIHVAGAV
jgi:cyanophycinase